MNDAPQECEGYDNLPYSDQLNSLTHTYSLKLFCFYESCVDNDTFFGSVDDLDLHIVESHSGPNAQRSRNSDYLCIYEECAGLEPFGSKADVQRHIVVKHTAKPFPDCEYPGCEKRFSSTSSMLQHMRGVHKCNVPHRKRGPVRAPDARPLVGCEYPGCDTRFTHKYNMLRHMRGFHKCDIPKQRQRKTLPRDSDIDDATIPALADGSSSTN